MEKLMLLAEKIKDRELRKKVVELLGNPKMSHPDFDYKPSDLDKMPASVKFHHIREGGLVEHTYAVACMSIGMAKTLNEIYGYEINMDTLIAAALIHDVGKCWRIKKFGDRWVMTKATMDHTILGTIELYTRGFPESVIHMVASHTGDYGTTEPNSIEAIILHYADTLDAVLDVKSHNGEGSNGHNGNGSRF